jgi:NADPH:quinone reductase-like Zn-dependent oxidoreductase
MPLFASATIEPLIDARFALKDAAEAHKLMEQGGHFGKIILSNQD